MRHGGAPDSGQAAVEYIGMLLVASVIIATVSFSGVATTVAGAIQRQICIVATSERECPGTRASTEESDRSSTSRVPQRSVPPLALGEVREIVAGTTAGVSDQTTTLTRYNLVKKGACGAAYVIARGVDVVVGGFAFVIVDAFCNGITKGVRYVERQLKPVIDKLCGKNGAHCKTVINTLCGVLNKVDRRACRVLKDLACFASDLNLFCSKAQRAVKKQEMVDGKRGLVVPYGAGRTQGLDELGRARGATATISAKTIRSRAKSENKRKGDVPSSQRVAGFKRRCGLDRGHLVGRQFGGPGDIQSNLIPLQSGFNQRTMRRVENQIANYVKKHDLTIQYTVTPLYEGNSTQPSRIDIEVRQVGGKPVSGRRYNPTFRLDNIPQVDTAKC